MSAAARDQNDDSPLAGQTVDIESAIVAGKVFISATDCLGYLQTVSAGLNDAIAVYEKRGVATADLSSQRIIVDGMIGALLEGLATLPERPDE